MMSTNESTEEKIKASAKVIFMQKGFAATKTRDIAEHADINLALVNYYFRSKENLFQQIMMESMQGFFSSMMKVFFDEASSLDEKLNTLASAYIDMLISQPNMPLFILNELQSNPEKFVKKVSAGAHLKNSVLFKQIIETLGPDKSAKLNPVHLFMNLMGLIVFPFIGRPMFHFAMGVEQKEFNKMMQERKELIPIWIKDMISA
ncbi:MAG: TetR family transcriptional regulator [Reichenbachiella sp.]|uniref:TetR/AcrR family transcriptional regulator n=1 Tax=Reichenbachiella sp. TaxID=2184521 RepID=UPI003262CD39